MSDEKAFIGRPPKGAKPQSTRLYVRAIDTEKETLEAAAEAAGMKLSEWVRDRLLRAAKRELKYR